MRLAKYLISIIFLGGAVTIQTGAFAADYIVDAQIQRVRVSGSISTNGTLGSLAVDDITGFDFLFQDLAAGTTFRQTKSNATVSLFGSGFTATDGGLFFDLGAHDGSLLRFAPVGATSDDNTLCIDSVNSICFADGNDQGSQFNVRLTDDTYGAYSLRNEQFATASPIQSTVPESSVWVMMIAGFGAVGFSMRRRSRATVHA